MADEKQKTESKIVLEREYTVPLRKEWLKAQQFRRAKKAVKALKEFLVKHMKIYDRDLRKVRVDIHLNNEIRFRGMKYPPAKIKVKAVKYEDGTVSVKLAELPKRIEFAIARQVKKEADRILKSEGKEKKAEEKPEESAEKAEDIKEKEVSSKEAMQAIEKSKAQEAKHTPMSKVATGREPEIKRKALKR